MKFYSIKEKKSVMVPEKDITYTKTKNGRKMAVGMYKGSKVYKFV